MKKTEDILIERGENYGDYLQMSGISQGLKEIIRRSPGWERLSPDKKESLDMTCTKISRILLGNPDLIDSWQDISGYSELIAESLGDISR